MRFYRQQTVKTVLLDITVSTTLSAEVDLAGYGLVGLIIPTIETGAVTFQVAQASGGSFVDLKDKSAAAISITAGTGGFAVSADDLAPLCAYRYIKVKTAGTQLANRTFAFVLKG